MKDMDQNDFYETDELVEDVKAAYESGLKGFTGLPGGASLVLPSPTIGTGSTTLSTTSVSGHITVSVPVRA